MSISFPEFSDLVGVTLTSVVGRVGGDSIIMTATDGRVFTLHHEQDCCESVRVEDIAGDLEDLVCVPIMLAEEESNREKDTDGDSMTWTFYKLRTSKGDVTIRWLGSSNGYYSESVHMSMVSP